MKPLDLKYTYNTPWRQSYKEMWDNIPSFQKEPSIQTVDNGIILPSIKDEKQDWGKGGVLDFEGNLVESSVVPCAFGGKYEYDKNNLVEIDKTIVCLGILPLHWGHFLIDFLCRLWILEEKYDYQLAYIPRFCDKSIEEPHKECLDLLGIDEHKMLRIEQPTKVSKIIIPENSMGFGSTFSVEKYTLLIKRITEKAIVKATQQNLIPYEKIYLTRRKFARKDIGEKEIEKNFRQNGFKVLSPEKLSFVEQVFYIHSAKTVAAIGGTITHSFMFAQEGAKLILLNRFPKPNMAQLKINYIFNLDITIIDVYNKWQLKHIREYGDPLIWIEFSETLKNYFEDNKMTYSTCSFKTHVLNHITFFLRWVVKKNIKTAFKRIINIKK